MSEPTETLMAPDPAAVKAEMLKIYPAKTAKKRAKQIILNDPETPPEIARQLPHGAGHHHAARLHLRRLPRRGDGADLRPAPNHPRAGRLRLLRLATRRNLVRPPEGTTNYLQYCMNTDMQEDQIVFGGEKKLSRPSARRTRFSSPRRLPFSPPVRSASSATTSIRWRGR